MANPEINNEARAEKCASEHVAYVVKNVSTSENPDSIEFGKAGERIKVYGDLSTLEGVAVMRQKLVTAVELVREATGNGAPSGAPSPLPAVSSCKVCGREAKPGHFCAACEAAEIASAARAEWEDELAKGYGPARSD